MSPKEIKSVIVSCCLICLGLTLAGCRASEAQETQEEEAEMAIQITSSVFSEGEAIPKKHTCSGEDVSPPLAWIGTPQAAKSLAIIMDDPDAPGKTFVHWVLFNIPPGTVELAEGARGAGVAGVNDFRRTGYKGPCPPAGQTHRYFFKIYALDQELKLAEGASKAEVEKAMKGHILASGQWMGKFSR
jgi:Raf kinase inhibitor-like YbhB/YbcL family protein